MKTTQRIGFVVLALAAFLVWSSGEALAVIVHTSVENYYSTGGTAIGSCVGEGCPAGGSQTVGNVTGTVQWEVKEIVSRDTTANTIEFNYTLINDTVSPNISSFHVTNSGFILVAGTSPTGWSFAPNVPAGFWSWQVSAPPVAVLNPIGTPGPCTLGVTGCSALGGFDVLITGGNAITVGFTPTSVDSWSLASPFAPVTGANWVVSAPVPVPEPATLLLLGTGLVGLGAWGRRKWTDISKGDGF